MPRGWNILATKLRTLGIMPHLRIFKAPLEDKPFTKGRGVRVQEWGKPL